MMDGALAGRMMDGVLAGAMQAGFQMAEDKRVESKPAWQGK